MSSFLLTVSRKRKLCRYINGPERPAWPEEAHLIPWLLASGQNFPFFLDQLSHELLPCRLDLFAPDPGIPEVQVLWLIACGEVDTPPGS
jgi:hypothetical protein